jgi:SAM-dependent methyltransferase
VAHATSLDELRKRVADLGIGGWFNEDDGMAFFTHLTKDAPKTGSFVEIGSWMGRSTAFIATAAILRKQPMVAIDHFVGSEEHDNLMPGLNGTTWPQYEFNMKNLGLFDYINTLKMKAEEALPIVTEKFAPIAFLFVDGAHDFDSVTRNINQYGPLVMPGGCILFHDHGNVNTATALTANQYLKDHFQTMSLNGMRMEYKLGRLHHDTQIQ